MAKRRPKAPAPVPASPPPPPPLAPSTTNRFERDVELMARRGADMGRFRAVIDALLSREPLPPEFRDHPLKGDRKGWRDCHVAPDWIIIYRKTDAELILDRTGTHADLFE